MISNLDTDFKLIMGNSSQSLNFLDINLQIVQKIYKPTNSFNYLTGTSGHSSHTKINISLYLAKRIAITAINDGKNRSEKLEEHLLDTKYLQHIIDYSFTKYFSQNFKLEIKIALHKGHITSHPSEKIP